MYKFVHQCVTASSFFVFFFGSALMSWVMIPLVQLFIRDPERRTEACARLMLRGTQFFFWWMRTGRLIEIKHGPVPADMPKPGEPYVMLANHPSLVDSVLLMGSFFRLNTVAKPSYYNSWMVGRFLRATGNLCAPTPNAQTPFGATLVLDLMVKHLKAGKALLVFPEGTRSPAHKLRRFRRGACEAAIRAQVPIVPVFIDVDPPSLLKGQKWYAIPHEMMTFTIEYLPVIQTKDRGLDSRELNSELHHEFRTRCLALAKKRAPEMTREAADASELNDEAADTSGLDYATADSSSHSLPRR